MERIRKFLGRQYDLSSAKEREVPKKGFPRFVYLLFSEPGSLILLNLFFLLTCIPIITIPAALCAMSRYLMKMVRDGYGFEWSDYLKEYRAQLVKSLPVGILCGLLLFYSYYLLSFAPQLGGTKSGFCIAIAVICIAAGVCIGAYAFPIMALFDLKVADVLKDTVIIAAAKWPVTLLVLADAAAFFALIFLSAPFSFVYLLIVGFSVHQVAVCLIVNGAIQELMIDPYEGK